ncbi:toll/interleukin-1 receptor domain-containing protein [Dyadobacter aurulentus]|uniref:toll/interleukin-1 receptor domain-containing protein n=1 Tax=Dyadobacter sp. UC 10 TaxID=2605428 RepID=UPI0011F23540|nr:toll/interleukin-1 receptor domain-containing protein [Dyadobacter sp. UC 10]KAA0989275.1 toll/interleukin-1 receptor domain-containing protein [Dyadobacter sp. UC 10]
MNAFISYSHNDAEMLTLLHTHLAQLQRDGLVSTWTDREILAGGNLNDSISRSLNNSNIFIALLSPSYIASTYCYEKEFVRAIQRQEEGKLVIVPTIVEPCDWLNTPFSQFKALPKDGKAITTWENKNTAFVDVIQNLRKLIENGGLTDDIPSQPEHSEIPKTGRNYRVQKDFDSIQKMEFIEQSFKEIKEHINRYLQEINELENIRRCLGIARNGDRTIFAVTKH